MSMINLSGASSFTQSLNMFLLEYMNKLNVGGGRNNIPVWAFYQRCKNAACTEDAVWYHCTICHPEYPQNISEGIKGVVIYNRLNTYSVHKHGISTHTRDHKVFMRFYDRKMRHER